MIFWHQARRRLLFVKHDLDSLTRADLQTRYAAHASGIAAGFLTRNEARQMENLPTLPGLDEPLSPLNMGSGNPSPQKTNALADQLAKNAVLTKRSYWPMATPASDVYTKLLPGYLRDKAGPVHREVRRVLLPAATISRRLSVSRWVTCSHNF